MTKLHFGHQGSLNHVCSDDQHCITCSDEAIEVRVVAVDLRTLLATVEVQGQIAHVDVSFVDTVTPHDRLLVHGGVAIARL